MAADVDAERAQVDALRRRVINVVGHALRTPVTTLRGLVDALDATDDPEARERIIPSVVRSTRTLERLLDDLLVVSGVTTVMPVRSPERTHPGELAAAVWGELGHPRDELAIRGDGTAMIGRDALRWILWHLLDNAASYGGRPVEVEVAETPAAVVVEIGTPGGEWPSEDLSVLFELFYRGEDAVTAKAGMGIGLPVARTLSERAGGTLSLRAREGGGLVARLELPSP